MTGLEILLIIIVGLLVGVLLFGLLLQKKKLGQTFDNAQKDSKLILESGRKEAEKIVRSAIQEAKEDSRRRRRSFDEEAKRRRTEINKSEKQLRHREQKLEAALQTVELREKRTLQREEEVVAEEKRKLKAIAEYELALEKKPKNTRKNGTHVCRGSQKRAHAFFRA